MRVMVALLALAMSAVPAMSQAQQPIDEEAARSRIPHYEEMKQAATRGREMYLYDQAAWHATDRFLIDWGERPTTALRGYFVEPGDEDRLVTVFFGEQDGKLVEVARYRVSGSEVIEGGLLDEAARPELSALGRRLIDARQAAFAEASEEQFGLCNRSPPNTLILPPDGDGVVSVYLMTAQTETGSYPIGGHYRIDVGSDGKVVASRRFLNTCFAAQYEGVRAEDGSPMTPESLFLTHLLDPQLTEIHVFASYYVPVMLMVGTTQNRLLWSARRGSVGYVGSLDELSRERD